MNTNATQETFMNALAELYCKVKSIYGQAHVSPQSGFKNAYIATKTKENAVSSQTPEFHISTTGVASNYIRMRYVNLAKGMPAKTETEKAEKKEYVRFVLNAILQDITPALQRLGVDANRLQVKNRSIVLHGFDWSNIETSMLTALQVERAMTNSYKSLGFEESLLEYSAGNL